MHLISNKHFCMENFHKYSPSKKGDLKSHPKQKTKSFSIISTYFIVIQKLTCNFSRKSKFSTEISNLNTKLKKNKKIQIQKQAFSCAVDILSMLSDGPK